jgi:hypothetical protein
MVGSPVGIKVYSATGGSDTALATTGAAFDNYLYVAGGNANISSTTPGATGSTTTTVNSGTASISSGTANISSAGSGTAHANTPQFLTGNWIIRTAVQ